LCLSLIDAKEDFGCLTDEDSDKLRYHIRKKRDEKKILNLNYWLVEMIVQSISKDPNERFNLKELIFFCKILGSEEFEEKFTKCVLSKKNRLEFLNKRNLQMERQVSITDEDIKDQDINPDIMKIININLDQELNQRTNDQRFLKRNYNLFEEFNYLFKTIIILFKAPYFQDDTRDFEIKNHLNILSYDPHHAVKFIKDCHRKIIDEKNLVNLKFQKQILGII